MSGELSLSVFTAEVDRVPIFAVQGKWQSQAEKVLTDEAVREQLRRLTAGGKPLCDHFSIFRMRIARADERAKFFESKDTLLTTDGGLAVLLVELAVLLVEVDSQP
jgi:hypothetical protein